MFSRDKIGFIGLDISDGSLEAVQLRSRRPGSFAISGWSRVVLPSGVIQAGRLIKTNEFSESLRQLLSRPTFGALDSRHVVVSVPEHQCFHHVFALSSWDGEGSSFNQIQETFATKLPFNMADVYWDWVSVQETATSTYVHCVAVPKEIVDSYREAFSGLGIIAIAMEPQVISASRLFWNQPVLTEPVLLIDFGANETALATIDDLGVHQSSVVPKGLSHCITDLAKKLGTDQTTAQKVLRSIGLRQVKHPKAAVIHQTMKETLMPIINEARQHVSFYSVQPHVQPAVIKQLQLIGGGALVPGVVEWLTQELRLIMAEMKPAATLQPPLASNETVVLANALGAAMYAPGDPQHDGGSINVLVTRHEWVTQSPSIFTKLRQRFARKKADAKS